MSTGFLNMFLVNTLNSAGVEPKNKRKKHAKSHFSKEMSSGAVTDPHHFAECQPETAPSDPQPNL
jgi:hypothetical protein